MDKSKKIEYGKNMILITTFWNTNQKTFKLMPLVESCPFLEILYEPKDRLLIPVLKADKQNFQMIPKLDDNGDPIMMKNKKRPQGQPFKEQRVLLTVKQEFYIIDEKEQIAFIEQFAVNGKTFNFKQYLEKDESKQPLITSKKPGLLDKKGNKIITAKN